MRRGRSIGERRRGEGAAASIAARFLAVYVPLAGAGVAVFTITRDAVPWFLAAFLALPALMLASMWFLARRSS